MKIKHIKIDDDLIFESKIVLSAVELLIINEALCQFAKNKDNHKQNVKISEDMRKQIVDSVMGVHCERRE